MPSFTADAYLGFGGSESGGALPPNSNWTHVSADNQVVNERGGNADTSTDYILISSILYSGYAIEIGGQDYTIFTNG